MILIDGPVDTTRVLSETGGFRLRFRCSCERQPSFSTKPKFSGSWGFWGTPHGGVKYSAGVESHIYPINPGETLTFGEVALVYTGPKILQ